MASRLSVLLCGMRQQGVVILLLPSVALGRLDHPIP